MEIIPRFQPFWLEDGCSMRLIPPLSHCVQTGHWEPLEGAERSSHSFCHFPATFLGTELCSLYFFPMKLSSGCLLHPGEKKQLELTACFGKERSNPELCKPTGPIAAVFGEGCLHHKKEQPPGTGREELTEGSWAAGEEAALPGLGRVTDGSRTRAFGSDTQVCTVPRYPKFHLEQVTELSANPSQLSSNTLSTREQRSTLGIPPWEGIKDGCSSRGYLHGHGGLC